MKVVNSSSSQCSSLLLLSLGETEKGCEGSGAGRTATRSFGSKQGKHYPLAAAAGAATAGIN